MSRRPVSALAAAALTATLAGAAVTTGAAPSYAESIAAPDPTGDVVSFDETGHARDAPRAKVTDAVRTRIRYGRQVLVVRTEARAAADRVLRTVQVLNQDTGRRYSFARRGPGGTGQKVPGCSSISTIVDQDTATYVVKVPARCFGAPSLARVAVGLSTITPNADGRYTADDAQDGPFDPDSGYYAFNRALQRG